MELYSIPIDWTDATEDFLTTGSATVANYAITSQRFVLEFQNKDAAEVSGISVFAQDGDKTDAVFVVLSGLGIPGGANTEYLQMGWSATNERYEIKTGESGTGDVQELAIYTGDNTGQLVLDAATDNISMSGALTVGSLITGGDIGVAADTDLLQLADGLLTVNGNISTGNDAHYIYTNHLGALVDADTYITFAGDVFYFVAGGLEFARFRERLIGSDEMIVNENGVDIDFRVEAVGQANALFVRGSDGKVGFNEGSPNAKLDVNGTSRFGDSDTNYTAVSATGTLTMAGSARVIRSEWIPVHGLKPGPASPAAWVAHGLSGAYRFADNAEDEIVGNIGIPLDMDRSVAPEFYIGWSTTDDTQKDCVWHLQWTYRAPAEDTTVEESTDTSADTACAVAEGLNIHEVDLSIVDSLDVCVHFKLTRMAIGATGDTIVDAVELHGVCMRYTKNKLGL